MAQRPTVEELLAYLDLTGDAYPPEQAQDALDAALEVQATVCRTDPYTVSLANAALRRAARSLAARGAPLGALDTGQFGQSPLPRWDAEIEAFEAARRRAPIG